MWPSCETSPDLEQVSEDDFDDNTLSVTQESTLDVDIGSPLDRKVRSSMLSDFREINRHFNVRETVVNPDFPERISSSQLGRSTRDIVKHNKWPIMKWIKYASWTIWAFALMIIFGSASAWAYPDGGNPTCVEEGDKNSAMCGVQSVLSEGRLSLAFLSSFILGGFLLSTRKLWLARRTAYCALCGATRNLLINVTTLAPPGAQRLLARWALLGYELSVLKARSLLDSNEGKKYLQISKLIVGNEWDSMVNGDRHTTAWYWIQSKAKRLKDGGQIDGDELKTICNAVTLSRDKANDLMSVIDRDQPPPYVFVCAILININLFLVSTAKGLDWSVWMNDAGGIQIFTEPRLYCDIIILYMYTTIFAMLFDSCALLYNPFGPRCFDIKHDIVAKGIRQLGISLSKESGSIPNTIDEDLDSSNRRVNPLDDPTISRKIASAEQKLRNRCRGAGRGTLLTAFQGTSQRFEGNENGKNTLLPTLNRHN